jgi:hypothetical protein
MDKTWVCLLSLSMNAEKTNNVFVFVIVLLNVQTPADDPSQKGSKKEGYMQEIAYHASGKKEQMFL